MKKKIILAAAVLVAALLVVLKFAAPGLQARAPEFKFAELTRGDVEETISCSGTLNPVNSVEVGTQISGIVAQVLVDYNDEVKEDQLLAVLDTAVLEEDVKEARAKLDSAQAQYGEALAEYRRHKPLLKKGYVSESEFLPISTSLQTARSGVETAKASLQRAERNLGYAHIKSPIDGVVISRNVEVGQTMAASLNAPTLFVIAGNLSNMEIIAQVDESDVSLVKEGQEVRFEVQSFPDRDFPGVVEKIRLQPVTVSNVVNYEVVIKTANEKELLLPGMTAEIEFIVKSAKNALLAPNSALAFRPSEEIRAELRKRKGPGQAGKRPAPSGEKKEAKGSSASGKGTLWHVNEKGEIDMARVSLGMTDGSFTQIMEAGRLKEGDPVITGLADSEDSGSSSKKSFSLLPRPRGGRGPRF